MRSNRKGPRPMITLIGLSERRALRMTQEALAEYLGCNRRYVVRLEKGEVKPSVETLGQLASLFGNIMWTDGESYYMVTKTAPPPMPEPMK